MTKQNINDDYLSDLDRIPEETWVYVIKHSGDFTWNFLAMKIILTRLNLIIAKQPNSDAVLSQCCEELRDLLHKSINIPNAQKDLQQILMLVK
jgi:hypothetical protein